MPTLLEWISPEITVKPLTSPSYPLNLQCTQTFPVYTQHPLMVTPECPDNSLTSPEVYPVHPDYPLRCREKPMSAPRTPWHPLMVTPDGPNFPLTFPDRTFGPFLSFIAKSLTLLIVWYFAVNSPYLRSILSFNFFFAYIAVNVSFWAHSTWAVPRPLVCALQQTHWPM